MFLSSRGVPSFLRAGRRRGRLQGGVSLLSPGGCDHCSLRRSRRGGHGRHLQWPRAGGHARRQGPGPGLPRSCLLRSPALLAPADCDAALPRRRTNLRPARALTRSVDVQFNWEDVKEDTQSQCYLGHSVKAAHGRSRAPCGMMARGCVAPRPSSVSHTPTPTPTHTPAHARPRTRARPRCTSPRCTSPALRAQRNGPMSAGQSHAARGGAWLGSTDVSAR